MISLRAGIWLLLVAALAACPACIRRTMSIRSEPPGALVYIDGQEVGRTPIDHVTFYFYGTRDIALAREGHLVERETVHVAPPWYSCFPIEIVTELLPWRVRDHRYFYFDLRPVGPMEKAVLLRHADEFRQIAKTEIQAARAIASYRPKQYVIERARKPSIFWGPFYSPPRGTPLRPTFPGAKLEGEEAP